MPNKNTVCTTSGCGITGRWLLRFHHISGSSSHKDCNCNFWKSQKPIELRVCVDLEFLNLVQAGGTHELIQLYCRAWNNNCRTESPFLFLKKKKKKKTRCVLTIDAEHVLEFSVLSSFLTSHKKKKKRTEKRKAKKEYCTPRVGNWVESRRI